MVHGTAGIAGPWAAGLPVEAPVALIDQRCGYRPVEGADTVVVRDAGARPGAQALQTVQQLQLGEGPVSGFFAGEQQLASGGRRHLVNVCGVPKSAVDFTGCWRLG